MRAIVAVAFILCFALFTVVKAYPSAIPDALADPHRRHYGFGGGFGRYGGGYGGYGGFGGGGFGGFGGGYGGGYGGGFGGYPGYGYFG